MTPDKLTIILPRNDMQAVLNAVMTRPYSEVAVLLAEISRQIDAQCQPERQPETKPELIEDRSVSRSRK